MDIFAIVVFLAIFLLLGRQLARAKDKRELDALEAQLDRTMFVTVEKHTKEAGTVFLMFQLVDDQFLMQAPTAAGLVAAAKAKWPNKLIMVHGDKEMASLPEFNEVTPPFEK